MQRGVLLYKNKLVLSSKSACLPMVLQEFHSTQAGGHSGETRVEAVAADLVDRDEALRQLKHNLLRAQQQMKKYADKKRRDVSLEVGEWVFLKLRPHRQQTVARRINQKLAPRYFGPYPILARVGAVSYRLKLPESARIHSVFHVSQLKKCLEDKAIVAGVGKDRELDNGPGAVPDVGLVTKRPITWKVYSRRKKGGAGERKGEAEVEL
ncbi:hypothetical protein KIW84_022565 [Lathyrus oleraceus]|uniref:Tf2-1-like SH3-like domain-containing protein n=1 Tax=Pisum sativum TaxID=3888 RepID=A0A9D4YF81_PEA|nr:hypothetical protein KIW84_022565 [Pisum sativum]